MTLNWSSFVPAVFKISSETHRRFWNRKYVEFESKIDPKIDHNDQKFTKYRLQIGPISFQKSLSNQPNQNLTKNDQKMTKNLPQIIRKSTIMIRNSPNIDLRWAQFRSRNQPNLN